MFTPLVIESPIAVKTMSITEACRILAFEDYRDLEGMREFATAAAIVDVDLFIYHIIRNKNVNSSFQAMVEESQIDFDKYVSIIMGRGHPAPWFREQVNKLKEEGFFKWKN